MNDFTKDELQYLLEMVDLIQMVNPSVNIDDLPRKLQSMIDNYCEHEHLKDVGREYKVCKGCAKEIYE
jgi:hypothetical protein